MRASVDEQPPTNHGCRVRGRCSTAKPEVVSMARKEDTLVYLSRIIRVRESQMENGVRHFIHVHIRCVVLQRRTRQVIRRCRGGGKAPIVEMGGFSSRCLTPATRTIGTVASSPGVCFIPNVLLSRLRASLRLYE